MVGHAVHPEEPLMSAGLDSRGAMELRRSLADSIGMQLPATLLYDHQSVSAIVDFISSTVGVTPDADTAADAGASRRRGDSSDDEGGQVCALLSGNDLWIARILPIGVR